MAMIQSSPVEIAARSERNWLFVLAGWIVISALVTGILTVLLYKKTGKYQEAAQKDADARIAESNAEAKRAGESAANALKDAGVANEKAGKANERAEKLERGNLTLRGQVATLETAAADAQKDVAALQKAAADAKAAQQRVETELAKQQILAAEAETKLIAAKKEIRDIRALKNRALSESQEQRLVDDLNQIGTALRTPVNPARAEIVIKCWAEPFTGQSCAFAEKLGELFAVSWSVSVLEQPESSRGSSGLSLRSDLSEKGVDITNSIRRAFSNVGITVDIDLKGKANAKPGQIELIVTPIVPSL